MRDRAFILYSWATVVLWYGFIWLLSSIPNLDTTGSQTHWMISGAGYQLAYALLFLLIYRAILMTLRLRVDRLMYWKSKREKSEDEQFANIVEKLVMSVAALMCIALMALDEYHQLGITGRIATIIDVAVNFTGVAVAAVVTYLLPILIELEARLAKVGKK